MGGRRLSSSQPTYKEWKGQIQQGIDHHHGPFPAYLQGMESAGFWPRCDTRPGFPAYLQGMERRAGGKGNRFPKLGSQPTYKEWKVLQRPRPNGGEGSSQPTYKEWKVEKFSFDAKGA